MLLPAAPALSQTAAAGGIHTKDMPDLSADDAAIMPQVSLPRVGSCGAN